jgi:hypothetical protein
MSSPFFSDDKGNKIYGQEDPTIKALKKSASQGQKRGTSRISNGGSFPAPLVNPLSTDGSLGDWVSTTPVQFLPYPGVESKTGFTDPESTDYDTKDYDQNGEALTSSDRISQRRESYNYFLDYSGKEFTHLLDYFMDQQGLVSERKMDISGNPDTHDIYLGSFIRTIDDNEDPTMLGYDVTIKLDDSPLFNGTIESFITQFSGLNNTEIGSRLDTLSEFKSQLFKFLKTNSPISSNSPSFLDSAGSGVKVYYMKNLTGLNNLVDSSDSSKIKSFIDYGSDMMTLEFNEDVSQNIGYLSSLYKSLSWSRINGKQIIPENLLRFDVDITITEVRKFNRMVGNKTKTIEIYPDLISKYTYTLYECQFFFPTMPHGDSIDMSDVKLIDGYEIKFNYKYSTMKFSKFKIGPSPDDTKSEISIDNKYVDISKVRSNDTNKTTINNNTISSIPGIYNLNKYITYSDDGKTTIESSKTGLLVDIKKSNNMSSILKKASTKLRKDVTNAVINEANRQILSQAALLNRTIDNIRNAIPGAGRMSEPSNVYYDAAGNYRRDGAPLTNDLINAARGFVGTSIKGFFTNP